MKRVLVAILLLSMAGGVSAQKVVFENVKIRRHRSSEKRVLVDKVGILTFDDSTRSLAFKAGASDDIEVGYDDVGNIVFDATTHMRGGVLSQVIQAAPFAGPVVGTAVAGAHVSDYWFYLEYKQHGEIGSALLVVPKSASPQVIDKATSVFGSRVTVANFTEKGVPVDKGDLKAVNSKQTLTINKQNHPVPELKPDKATVLVVCPPLAARYAGRGNQFKLHANDEVIAVNREGTYSFAYLSPGKYRLVSQAEDANGFEMELEAGHEYFFLQNIFQGVFKGETGLTRNSREVVLYLAEGSYLSEWKTKEP
jgi:hypothetical protein